MTGYIQRLLDRATSFSNTQTIDTSPDTEFLSIKPVERLTAPLVEQDQRLLTGDESLSDIEDFLERENNTVPYNDIWGELTYLSPDRTASPQRRNVRDPHQSATVPPEQNKGQKIEQGPKDAAQAELNADPKQPSFPHATAPLRDEKAYLPDMPLPHKMLLNKYDHTDAEDEQIREHSDYHSGEKLHARPRRAEIKLKPFSPEIDVPDIDETPHHQATTKPYFDENQNEARSEPAPLAEPHPTKLKIIHEAGKIEASVDKAENVSTALPFAEPAKIQFHSEIITAHIEEAEPIRAPRQAVPVPNPGSEQQTNTFPNSIISDEAPAQKPAYMTAEAMSVIGSLPVRRRVQTIRGLRIR